MGKVEARIGSFADARRITVQDGKSSCRTSDRSRADAAAAKLTA